jgi:structural maintenance of chromosome 1
VSRRVCAVRANAAHAHRYAREDLDNSNDGIGKLTDEITKAAKELKKAQADLDKLNAAGKTRDASIAALEAEVSEAEGRVFAAFERKVNVPNVREYEARRVREAQARADELAALDAQRARLRQQIEFEESRAVAPALAKLEKRIDDEMAALAKLNKSIGAKDAAVATAEEALGKAHAVQTAAHHALTDVTEKTRVEREAVATATERHLQLLKQLAADVRSVCSVCLWQCVGV